MHFVAVDGNVGKALEEFEELRRADDRVGNGRGFDQVLLSEFCAEEAAFEETFRSYDRHRNVMSHACRRFIGE